LFYAPQVRSNRTYRFLRCVVVVGIFVTGFVAASAVQSAWWEAHPLSCMPSFDVFVPPDLPATRVSPTCLILRHYVAIDLVVAVGLSLLGWRFSRPIDPR